MKLGSDRTCPVWSSPPRSKLNPERDMRRRCWDLCTKFVSTGTKPRSQMLISYDQEELFNLPETSWPNRQGNINTAASGQNSQSCYFPRHFTIFSGPPARAAGSESEIQVQISLDERSLQEGEGLAHAHRKNDLK